MTVIKVDDYSDENYDYGVNVIPLPSGPKDGVSYTWFEGSTLQHNEFDAETLEKKD